MKKSQKEISKGYNSLIVEPIETNAMKNLQEFLLLCAGTDPSTVNKSPTDINKHIGVGGTILFTALFASIASGYALYFVFESWIISILFGVFWGAMIFNLDRYIVSSLRHRGSFLRRIWLATPRLAIAVVIAIVIATPLELKLFEKEIDATLVTIQQEVELEKETAARTRFVPQIESLQLEKDRLNQQLAESATRKDQLVQQAINEADGTGGSMRRNMGPIYATKKKAADEASAEHAAFEIRTRATLASIDEDISEQVALQAVTIATLDQTPFDGIAARMEALDRLSSTSSAIHSTHVFLFLLFMLIECSPLLVKLISERGTYDLHLHVREQQVELYHAEVTTLRSHRMKEKLKYETEIGTAKVNARIQLERARIRKDLDDQIEQLKGSTGWESI